jgi:site-specific DNA-methyltransferase (adenine-specific)/adenine-specific DNA-methyltransferase
MGAVLAARRGKEGDGLRLQWAGRKWRAEPVIPDARSAQNPAGNAVFAPERARLEIKTVERAGSSGDPGLSHRIIHGDNLDVAASIQAGSVDCVYVDPPYSSDRDYVAEARLDGPADGRSRRTLAYEDKWTIGSYLDMLAPRIEALANLLSPRGTIWVHLDWRAAYLVRNVLDEIMGREAFVNEIIWRRAPNLGRQATSGQFGRTLDTIVVYGREKAVLRPPTRLEPIDEGAIRWDDEGRPFTSAPRGDYTDQSIAKLEKEGRVHRTATGRVYIKYFLRKNEEGVWCRERRIDALWTDVPPLRHAATSERTGYPTQKPRALLERIIACSTDEGSLVVDGFGGSGTTAVAAHALKRRAVICDKSPVAIATARARMLRDKASITVEQVHGMSLPEMSPPVVKRKSETLQLVSPEEPLAWAIGKDDAGVFNTLWHFERTNGAKTVQATREAHVGNRPGLGVRVFGDDGSIGTWRSP